MGVLRARELEGEVKANLGNRDDLDDRLHRFLNFAQIQLARKHQFDELEKLVQTTLGENQAYLELPERPLDIHSLRLIDGVYSRKLIYYTPRQFDKFTAKADETSTARPTIYTSYRNILEFWRVSNADYVLYLRYKKYPTAFTRGSNTTSDFEAMDDIIIALATSWGYKSLGEEEKSIHWYRVAQGLIKEARIVDMLKVDFEPSGKFNVRGGATGAYWSDPFVKGVR